MAADSDRGCDSETLLFRGRGVTRSFICVASIRENAPVKGATQPPTPIPIYPIPPRCRFGNRGVIVFDDTSRRVTTLV